MSACVRVWVYIQTKKTSWVSRFLEKFLSERVNRGFDQQSKWKFSHGKWFVPNFLSKLNFNDAWFDLEQFFSIWSVWHASRVSFCFSHKKKSKMVQYEINELQFPRTFGLSWKIDFWLKLSLFISFHLITPYQTKSECHSSKCYLPKQYRQNVVVDCSFINPPFLFVLRQSCVHECNRPGHCLE